MAFTIDTPPGITDIPDSFLEAGALASGFTFSALKDNASFGSVVPEVFFGTYANGQVVPLPISTVDGYQYQQSELLYCWEVYNSLPSLGAQPSSDGALRACEWYVDQLTGTVHTMEFYCIGNAKGGSNTNDGILGVWTIGIRGRSLRTLAAAPTFTDISDSLFDEDNAATQTNLQNLSHNTKLGSVQCEVFMVNPSNAPVWQPNTQYAAGDLVQPMQDQCNGFWYVAANTGISASQEPSWTSIFRNAQPVSDGGVLWNVVGCGFLNGQQIDYPQSQIDGYQYSAADVIVPHLAFISTESMPVQFFSGVIDSSAAYPFGHCQKSVILNQQAAPTATTNRNFQTLVSQLNNEATVYTTKPANLQLFSPDYVAPAAMALADPVISPGDPTTGVGIVNCSVSYSSGTFDDGTVMVTLFCFRNINNFTPLTPPPGTKIVNQTATSTVYATQYATNLTFNASQYEFNSNLIRTKGSVGAGTLTSYVVARGFSSLAIPAGATINGITVTLSWAGQSTGTGILQNVALYYQGAAIGTAKSPKLVNSKPSLSNSYSTSTQGGATDLWGVTITPAILNDPTFGFGIQILTQESNGSDRSFLNFFTINVSYSAPVSEIGGNTTTAAGIFTDFSTIEMTTGNPLTEPYMQYINENAKFSMLRPEVFFCQYDAETTESLYTILSPDIIPGNQVPLPVSPMDGYQYSREELTYIWWFTQSSGAGGWQERVFGLYVDPNSGVINSTVQYIGLNSTTAGTNNANVTTIIYGAGGLIQATNTNWPLTEAPFYGQPSLNVIIFAQRQHETELQAQVIYETTASASQPSSTNLIPNGGFEIWSTPNPNYAELTGSADDWFVNWQQGSTNTTDMGVTNAIFQFPGQNANPGAGPSAPYGALSGSFSQCIAVIPSCQNNNSASDSDSRKHTPLPNGSATLSIVSEIVPVWPGGEYALSFLAAAYATTDFSPTGSTGDPEAGVSPDYIGAGFYARVHLLGMNSNGNGQPDMSTDTLFELVCDQNSPNGGSLLFPAGLTEGTNNGYGIFGTPGKLISPPMCEQFNFTFTIPANAGANAVPVTGLLTPGNSATPATSVPSIAFNYSPSAANPNNSVLCSTGLPATGPETIDFIPQFVYVEFLLWDIWGTGYDHLRVACFDNVILNDLTTGSTGALQLINQGNSSGLSLQGNLVGYGSMPFNYISTSTTITISWAAFSVHFASGETVTALPGSVTVSTQGTGSGALDPATVYDVAASIDTITLQVQNVTLWGPTTLGADSIVPAYYVSQVLNGDNNIGLLAGGAGGQSSTAMGGGTGSGSGRTPVPSVAPRA